MKICKYCQSEIDDNVKVCPHCKKQQPSIQRALILSLIIIVSVYALVLIAFLFGSNDENDSIDDVVDTNTDSQVNDIEAAPQYDDTIEVFYVTLYENHSSYKGKAVTISGPIKSKGNNVLGVNYLTISQGIDSGFAASVYINLHESQLANYNVGDYVTVSGIVDSMSFNSLNIDDAIVTDQGSNAQSVYEAQKESYESNKYTACDITAMIADLDSNALRAEATYQDAYIEVTGVINNIDSDGEYITLVAKNDKSYGWDSIHCNLTNDEQRNIIINKSKGDVITIRGQITSIGEVLGYVLEIHTIK